MNIRASPWRDAFRNLDVQSYHDLATAFHEKARVAQEAGADDHHRSLKLLGELCMMSLRSEKLDDPFGPMMSGSSGRTLIPDDLTEIELAALEELLPEVDNHWLRARVADTLWVRLKKTELIRMALESYLWLSDVEMSYPLEWLELMRRSLLIARRFDLEVWQSAIDEIVERFLRDTTDTITDKLDLFGLFSGYLREINQRDAVLDAMVSYGGNAIAANDYRIARECWKAVRDHYRAQQRRNEVYVLTHQIANSLLNEEESRRTEDDNEMVSDHFVRAALSEYTELPRVYRKEHGIEQIIVDLRKDLGRISAEVVRTMSTFSSGPIDITKMVHSTESELQGKSLADAMYVFAAMCYRTSVDSTRAMATSLVQDYPFKHIVGGSTYSSDGRVVAKSSPLDFDDPESYREVVEAETVRQFGTTLGLWVSGVIEPGLAVLQSEHHVSLAYCRRLVVRAILIPSDRTEAWAKGIYHGFNGEMFEATHILIPQIENWLRWLLQAAGYDTIVREKDGTDEQMSMESLLAHSAMKEMLIEGLWFELSYLFLHTYGAKLRNNLLHGLLADDEINTPQMYSFWHMCVRLVMLSQQSEHEPFDA
jgi:hypothetical protein